MKDINYDLIKLLHTKLETIGMLEHHCIHDAEAATCHSLPALQEILQDEKRHADMLAHEINMRSNAGIFD